MLVVICVTICLLVLTIGPRAENVHEPKLYSVHYRLVAQLFKDYDPALRPVENPLHQMEIHIEPSLDQIQKVNTAGNTIAIVISFDIYWKDIFLKWNPAQYDNITTIFMPSKKIWTPIFSTWYSVKSDDTIQTSEMEASINNTGGVYTSLVVQTESMCAMDVTLYPFDQQICTIYFGSLIHMHNTLKLVAPAPMDLGNYYEHQEWKLLQAAVVEMNFSWAGDPYPYSLLVVELKMKRHPFFYIFTMVMPVAIVVLVALVGFHIPGSSNTFMTGKIDLGMATLLSMTFLLYIVTINLPKFTTGVESTNRKSKSSGIPILVTLYVWLFCQVALSAMLTSLLTYVDKIIRMSGEVPEFIVLLANTFKLPSKITNNESEKNKVQTEVHTPKSTPMHNMNPEFESLMKQLLRMNDNLKYLRRINSVEPQWSQVYFRLNLFSLIFNLILWAMIIVMFFLNSWY